MCPKSVKLYNLEMFYKLKNKVVEIVGNSEFFESPILNPLLMLLLDLRLVTIIQLWLVHQLTFKIVHINIRHTPKTLPWRIP
ncbi:hypothetical protein BpHYR1_004971 [Brachionus plicatilis]|uniref:Uncharacterized protein n=1 Tax=Brachionus plicatilis TaxID=10195 RepID=A0A3M7T0M1_BRAPC|nr:hypothetical protein BpHYR1_004971 [Brachionus plicatilis]